MDRQIVVQNIMKYYSTANKNIKDMSNNWMSKRSQPQVVYTVCIQLCEVLEQANLIYWKNSE